MTNTPQEVPAVLPLGGEVYSIKAPKFLAFIDVLDLMDKTREFQRGAEYHQEIEGDTNAFKKIARGVEAAYIDKNLGSLKFMVKSMKDWRVYRIPMEKWAPEEKIKYHRFHLAILEMVQELAGIKKEEQIKVEQLTEQINSIVTGIQEEVPLKLRES